MKEIRGGLAHLVRPGAPAVFVTGGPPARPFPGPGPVTFSNPAFALHHARSWGSPFVLGWMPPLHTLAHPGDDAPRSVIERWLEGLAELSAGGVPPAVQVWGPLTLAAEREGTAEVLRLAIEDAHAAEQAIAAGLRAVMDVLPRALARARVATPPVLAWVAEPMVALLDPERLQRLWLPVLRRVTATASSAGAEVVVHASGRALHAVPVAALAGVGGISVGSGTPLAAAGDALPAGAVVFGNLDSMRLLDWDEARLREAGAAMAREMPGRRWVGTPGSAVSADTPVGALEAFRSGVLGAG
ncbi:MAG: hypothetical protein IBX62_03340, partial [Coriobacteriia bacterium]|nr:hypothetical protein [Coriobacteriia bacterium]